MVIFHSYVELPEGTLRSLEIILLVTGGESIVAYQRVLTSEEYVRWHQPIHISSN